MAAAFKHHVIGRRASRPQRSRTRRATATPPQQSAAAATAPVPQGSKAAPLPSSGASASTEQCQREPQLQTQQQREPQPQPQPRARNSWTAPTAAISVSGPYLTTSSIDGDAMAMTSDFLERELAGPYRFSQHQHEIIQGLTEEMRNCSTAFVAVALAGIALTLAAGQGLDMEDAPEVLFNGLTVGDVASWVDSLLVAGLLRFGAESFARVEETQHEERQLAYTFQGLSRLGLIMQNFAIAATTVSIVTTLEAASKWPPLVTLASGFFFTAAVGRSCAMWFVLSRYGNTLDDVGAAMEAQRRAYDAAHNEQLPLIDRLAIRVAFSYLLQFSAAGRRPSAAALSSAVAAVAAADAAAAEAAAEGQQVAGSSGSGEATTTTTTSSSSSSSSRAGGGGGQAGPDPSIRRAGSASSLAAATAAAAVAVRDGGRSATAAAAQAARAGMGLLQKVPLPIISRSTDEAESEGARQSSEAAQAYTLTQAEERLVQACQSSLNTAGLALVLQAFATGMLLTANLAHQETGEAIGDIIQVINKAVAAELIFVGTANFDRALYAEGCDVDHLLEGLGSKGMSKLFHNLSILAYAVVLAKCVELAAPWEESSPLLKFMGENFSHQAADVVLEAQELLVNVVQ